MILAIARPAAVVTLPSQHETVILSMDVSGSMRATDVKPSRIAAAQEAARAFVAEQPKTTRIGVVSFAATASVVQSPTHSREDILAAIERFQLQRGTAVGSGILVALKMIFPDAEFDLRSSNPRREAARASPLDPAKATDKSDGQDRAAGIVLVGRDHPAHRRPDDDGPRPDRIGAHGGRPRRTRVHRRHRHARAGRRSAPKAGRCACDWTSSRSRRSPTVTQGEYFYAGTATDLQKIYKNLNTKLFFEQKETEISALFAAAAAGLALRVGTPVPALVQPDPLTANARAAAMRWRAGQARPRGAWPVSATLIAAFHCCGEMASAAMLVAQRCEPAQQRTDVVQ